jgi:Lectin C-type domain
MWLSGSDNDFNGTFYWESTGHAFGPFSYWSTGQPDDGALVNKTSENCVILNHMDSYQWHDFGCSSKELRFICEKRGATK